MSKPITRRHTLAAAMLALAASQYALPAAAQAQTASATPNATVASQPAIFEHIKQIHAGVLDVGYVDAGPADGPAVILLHGWPYDIHSYIDVVPLLTRAGYRVIVPYLRGYGTTRFIDAATPRNGQPAALASDVIALMDALNIDRAILAGYDWGARSAGIVAALWPQRVKGLVAVSGYLIGSQAAGQVALPPAAEQQWWYQFYFATERGRAGYEKNRHDFARLIWQTASPRWQFDDATFA
ncbi:MAG TPA: alpha/beta fold hydrolase, partial [Burkholderiaceae bacterium]|nr:alpha/beta fold hydrolase [Burkholderiaceae bacterium]